MVPQSFYERSKIGTSALSTFTYILFRFQHKIFNNISIMDEDCIEQWGYDFYWNRVKVFYQHNYIM